MTGTSSDCPPPGIFLEGYGLEVQGHGHKRVLDTAATVYLGQGTKYKLRLANANGYPCMVTVSVDDISIGTFLLNPYSKFDLERPLDRPLGFLFGSLPSPPAMAPDAAPPAIDRKQMLKDKTVIVATFKPQLGAKIVQIDVSHVSRTHRVELLNDTPVFELFSRLEKELGEFVSDAQTSLLHWTTAEFDSPVEDVMKADMQMHLGSCKRQYEPIRKMSIIIVQKISFEILGEVIFLEVQRSPTFGDAISYLREKVPGLATADIYFMSDAGRYIASTLWIKDHTFILQMLHKDEIPSDGGTLCIKVDVEPPENCFSLYARLLTGSSYQLEAGPHTTIRECRYQLEELGGPWGEDPRWMFGGTIMESGRTLGCYGVMHRVSVDVIPKLYDKGHYRDLQMRDPIAIEGEGKIDTAELIKTADQRANKQARKQQSNQKKPRRGATVLKGRIQQQFIEVDALEVDPRFFVGVSVTILPQELEDFDISTSDLSPTRERSTSSSSSAAVADKSSCSVS